MRTHLPNRILTRTLILGLVFLFFGTISGFGQDEFDGNWGDEYLDAQYTLVDPNASGTCNLADVWATVVTDTDNNKYLLIGFHHGNSGQSTFRFYVNDDGDLTTGHVIETFGSLEVDIEGIDKTLQLTTGNNAILTIFDNNNIEITDSDIDAKVGTFSDGQDDFFEILVPLTGLINTDDCEPIENISLVSYISFAGNTPQGKLPTSNLCEEVVTTIDWEIGLGGEATGDTICSGEGEEATFILKNKDEEGTVSIWQISENKNDVTSWIDIPNSSGKDTVLLNESDAATILGYTDLPIGTFYLRAQIHFPDEALCEGNGYYVYSSAASLEVEQCCNTIGGTISGSAEICTGTNSTTLTLEGGYQGTILIWQDSIDGGTWSNIADTDGDVSYTATNLSVTTYYRVIVQDGSCDSEYSSTATITVFPLPTPQITGNDDICLGDNLQLSASGGATYQWKLNGSPVATGPTYSSSSFADNDVVRLIATSSNGCVDSTDVTITVFPLPTPQITGNDDICLGDNLQLSASGGATYQWKLNGSQRRTVFPPG